MSSKFGAASFVFAILFGTAPCLAQTKPLWSIYWLSDKLPCEGYWGKPMTAAAAPCGKVGDSTISICPRPQDYPYPYNQGKPITIVGYQIVHILTEAMANGHMVVGSQHGGDGADVFASTGGVGTNSKSAMFPPGTGLPQGEMSDQPGVSHIDVYGWCDSGMQQALVILLYTSP
jgi:hypothetical protein